MSKKEIETCRRCGKPSILIENGLCLLCRLEKKEQTIKEKPMKERIQDMISHHKQKMLKEKRLVNSGIGRKEDVERHKALVEAGKELLLFEEDCHGEP